MDYRDKSHLLWRRTLQEFIPLPGLLMSALEVIRNGTIEYATPEKPFYKHMSRINAQKVNFTDMYLPSHTDLHLVSFSFSTYTSNFLKDHYTSGKRLSIFWLCHLFSQKWYVDITFHANPNWKMYRQQTCFNLVYDTDHSKAVVLVLFEPRHDKTNTNSVRQAKTQISLGIRPVFGMRSMSS